VSAAYRVKNIWGNADNAFSIGSGVVELESGGAAN
jgi:hypothetical protein